MCVISVVPEFHYCACVTICKFEMTPQCYDGASVMSGQFTGVQARIKEIAPHVTYFHCHAHRLNLVLVRTIKNIPEIAEFFEKVQCLYVFLTVSILDTNCFFKLKKNMALRCLSLRGL